MHVVFEVFPSPKLKLDAVPDAWHLALTCTAEEIQPTIDLYRTVGPRHTPHVSAALVESEDHARALAAAFDRRVFLIGGDLAPRGPFQRSAQLIPYFQGCAAIGVGGYPEGHPSYPAETFGDEILLEKQALGATYIATQMCFNPDHLVSWVRRIRERGVTLPVYCGVAPPINVINLTRFAVRCGVNTSLKFIKKMSTQDMVHMISRYDPRPLMEAVSEHVDGFHIFTFNAIKTTVEWVSKTPWLRQAIETPFHEPAAEGGPA